MSKWVVDIHGDIEGDYEIIKEYEEPKTGHWIDTNMEQEWYDEEFVCSECKGHMLGTTEFCPYCGARMESEETE